MAFTLPILSDKIPAGILVTPPANRATVLIIAHKLTNASDYKTKSVYLLKMIGKTSRIVMKALMMLVLFAPAYVIAYSFKTRFDTESIILMIIV